MNNCEEIESYVNEHLNKDIKFRCEEVKLLRTKANMRAKFFRVFFEWEEGGVKKTLGRRINSLHIKKELDGFVASLNEKNL